MSTLDFAKRELDIIGLKDCDDPMNKEDSMNYLMRQNILEIIEKFASQGHSGFSASYAISILEKLLRWEPLTSLTGEDSEWMHIHDQFGQTDEYSNLYQNKRLGRVFKKVFHDKSEKVYDINGLVFWEWYYPEGEDAPIKTYFTNRHSKTPVTFPYIPKTEYREWVPSEWGETE